MTAQVTVAPREYRRGVEPGSGDTAHRPGLGDDLGRPQQRLARHAGPVRALAAGKLRRVVGHLLGNSPAHYSGLKTGITEAS